MCIFVYILLPFRTYSCIYIDGIYREMFSKNVLANIRMCLDILCMQILFSVYFEGLCLFEEAEEEKTKKTLR